MKPHGTASKPWNSKIDVGMLREYSLSRCSLWSVDIDDSPPVKMLVTRWKLELYRT